MPARTGQQYLEGLRQHSRSMTFEGRAAVHRLELRRKIVGDDSIPELTAYQLQFETLHGNANQNPVRHRILIKRDMPPMVEIVSPSQPDRDVPADSNAYIQVRAFDPDFRISGMRIVGRKDGRLIFDEDLLQHKARKKPLEGAQRATFLFKPGRYGLKAGDVVEYRPATFHQEKIKKTKAMIQNKKKVSIGREKLREKFMREAQEQFIQYLKVKKNEAKLKKQELAEELRSPLRKTKTLR